MYCIKCGVELSDYENKCPLCKTPVYHPDITPTENGRLYPVPEHENNEMNRSGILFILTALFIIPILLTLVCDLSINGRILWSGYAVGALILTYLIIVLPLWFKNPNPVIFVPSDFIGIMLFLFYINYAVDGSWFLTFAFPLTGMLGLITSAVVTLCHYIKRGLLYIFGGAFILLGLAMVLTEMFEAITFNVSGPSWSIYPLVVFVLAGIMLIVIAVCPPLRESFKKKFFL